MCLLTVDLFSVYLLSRVDIVIRYIEVDFTFGLPDYVRYVPVKSKLQHPPPRENYQITVLTFQ